LVNGPSKLHLGTFGHVNRFGADRVVSYRFALWEPGSVSQFVTSFLLGFLWADVSIICLVGYICQIEVWDFLMIKSGYGVFLLYRSNLYIGLARRI